MSDLLLAYYGDDFTGSTDALEFLCRAGANTILFIEPPTLDVLAQYPGLQAYGVAGKTRALSPKAMEAVLLPAFETMKASGAQHLHYKTCSTFDSSPAIGSIGKAIDCGSRVFDNKIIPLLVAAPVLGRYCVFGNLFARMGIGSKGDIFRLDRHPAMSKHPVTPMDESDLRLHLAKQTHKKTGLIDILKLELPLAEMNAANGDAEVVLVDALYDEQLEKVGEWINYISEKGKPQFSVGSSGIEMALGKYWQRQGLLKEQNVWSAPARVEPLLVVSGSCSPVTTSQIKYAVAHGFKEVVIDAADVCSKNAIDDFLKDKIVGLLLGGSHIIVHTGQKQQRNLPSEILGTALGNLAKEATGRAGLKRVVFSGGDSSSYAARAMEIDAVRMIAPMSIGAPLCKAISANPAIDGLEVNFKGGQVGSENYFGLMTGDSK